MLIPLLKKNKPKKSLSSYRGITIISTIGKMFELTILESIGHLLVKSQNNLQRGFTAGVAPQFAAFILCEAMNEMADQKLDASLVFLDAEKAFDKVWHERLLCKLAEVGLPVESWCLIKDWYRNLKSQVKLQDSLSRPFVIQQGTLQGSSLSPHLFKTYINSTPDTVERLGIGAKIGTVNCATPTCADDIAAVAATGTRDCQRILGVTELETDKDRVVLSIPKTAVIARHNKSSDTSQLSEQPLSLKGRNLKVTEKAVHLGITHHTGPHGGKEVNQARVQACIKSGAKAAYMLFGAGFHGTNGLNPVLCIKIWRTYILPRMLYSTELWSLSKVNISTLEKFQSDKMKQLQGLPGNTSNAATLGLAGILPIEAEIDRRTLTLFRHMISDKNNPEYEIILRQLAMKSSKSHSWVLGIKHILEKYNLPAATSLLQDTPPKEAWKTLVDTAIKTVWQHWIQEETAKQSSCRFLSVDSLSLGNRSLVWAAAMGNVTESRKAQIKARLMCGTYRLQCHEAMYSRRTGETVTAFCRLCNGEPEDREHFLLRCEALTEIRKIYLPKIRRFTESWCRQADEATLLQTILDCTQNCPDHPVAGSETTLDIERHIQTYIYALHCRRAMTIHGHIPIPGKKRRTRGPKPARTRTRNR
jgi:hypothetical protein